MSYNAQTYISVERRKRADNTRATAWEDAQKLLDGGRVKSAYNLMVQACKQAWQIENPQPQR